jgi:hypothetical protein
VLTQYADPEFLRCLDDSIDVEGAGAEGMYWRGSEGMDCIEKVRPFRSYTAPCVLSL